MLMSQQDASLLLVDVQEKLTPYVHEQQTLIDHCRWLLELANEIEIPTLVSEQYPQGLGSTIPALKELTQASTYMDKVHFSCAADTGCLQHIRDINKKQVIVIGIETHVCILQTVLGLMNDGFDVFVVADAVGSRNPYDHDMGLQRMRANGAHIVTKEMVFFECLHQAGTEQFKQLSKRFFA